MIEKIEVLGENLRDTIGQAINDAIASGAPQADYCDSREIDRLANAVMAVLPAGVLARIRHLTCERDIARRAAAASQPVAAQQRAQVELSDKEIDLIMVTNGFPNTRPTAAFRSFARAILAASQQPAAVVPLQTYEAMRSACDHYQELYEQSAAPAIQVQESAALDERADFEVWLRSIWTAASYDCRRGPGGDSYASSEAQTLWTAWQARAALAAPAPVQPAPVADAVPDDSLSQQMDLPELNADLFDILGRPCFTCIKVAKRLREMGRVIPQRAENEQAETIYLFLSTYLKHGAKWRDEVEAYLKRGTAKPSEALQAEVGP